ncbi:MULTISPECIES: hypothetical protein [Burkholderia cepacia complex]|uniref:hypothetical protein n=1 Tax=Burkholderia cepacia complex TaxID=87882 RepID=UPI001D1122BD|nr:MULTISPECIES: hypothetical protein [Burkholderia cepacia complex]MCA8420110.1 hypothetical protein [Burkholderia cenocepacia]MDN7957936.1 hypothetical protein [Burkholderia orbicola]
MEAPFATASAIDAAPGAGWLWANAGGTSAAVSASSAQTILLMANAKTLCFIFFPLARRPRLLRACTL